MKEKKGQRAILTSTIYVMVTLVLVKFIGFIKQAVIAAYYGTTVEMDLYFISEKFVAELGIVFFSSLSITFLTMYLKEKNDEIKKAQELLSNTIVFFSLFSVVLIVLINIIAKPITYLIATGADNVQREILSGNIRKLSIILLNISISNICIATLEGNKKFIHGKVIGIIQSVILISATILLSEQCGINALIYGVIVYYFVQNVFLLVCVFKNDKFIFGVFYKDKRVIQLLKYSVPLFLSNAILQINVIVDQSIASKISEGSVSALAYSNTLFQMVHSIIIGSVGTVVFSYFSTYVAKKEYDKIKNVFRRGVEVLFPLCAFLTIILLTNSKAIIKIVYERGEFGSTSVLMTSYAFIGYIMGLVFVAMRDLLVKVHYAFQDTKNPTVNGCISVGINIVLSIVLGKKFGAFGIAFAGSVSYVIAMALSMITVRKHIFDIVYIKKTDILRVIVALILTALTGFFFNKLEIMYILKFVMTVIVQLVIYILGLYFLDYHPLKEAIDIIKDKIKLRKFYMDRR